MTAGRQVRRDSARQQRFAHEPTLPKAKQGDVGDVERPGRAVRQIPFVARLQEHFQMQMAGRPFARVGDDFQTARTTVTGKYRSQPIPVEWLTQVWAQFRHGTFVDKVQFKLDPRGAIGKAGGVTN